MISFNSLTKAQYDALSAITPDRIYFLTDTGELKLNGVDYGGSKQEEEPDYLTMNFLASDFQPAITFGTSSYYNWDYDLECSVNNSDWSKIDKFSTVIFPPFSSVKFRGDNPSGVFVNR